MWKIFTKYQALYQLGCSTSLLSWAHIRMYIWCLLVLFIHNYLLLLLYLYIVFNSWRHIWVIKIIGLFIINRPQLIKSSGNFILFFNVFISCFYSKLLITFLKKNQINDQKNNLEKKVKLNFLILGSTDKKYHTCQQNI